MSGSIDYCGVFGDVEDPLPSVDQRAILEICEEDLEASGQTIKLDG
jgi:hypothetical protein